MATPKQPQLTDEQQEILDKAVEQKAKRDAKKAESGKRASEAQAIREKRKAAGLPLKTDEEKAADFVRLGVKRMAKCVSAMKGVRNLANKSQYKYTDAQVAKIMTTLAAHLQSVEQAFEEKGSKIEEFDL